MINAVMIDLWVGVICEDRAFTHMQQQADKELGEGVVYFIQLRHVTDTYSTKFAFVLDLVRNGTADYDKIIRELKYRKIPIIDSTGVLNHIVKLMAA
jgi:hypothetical protein